MTSIAPRISPRLLAELERLDDGSISAAELCRRVGAAAERLDLPRPSYQRVRVLLREARRGRIRRAPTTAEILADVAFRARPPKAILEHIAGTLPPGPPRR